MNRIKQYLDRLGMTQREAAAKMGITEEHLSRVLNGKTPVTSAFKGVFGQTFGFDVAQRVFDTPATATPAISQEQPT